MNSEEERLIAKQAIEIERLTNTVSDLQIRMGQIRKTIVSIGAPLNDNKLGYTHEQLRPFKDICNLT